MIWLKLTVITKIVFTSEHTKTNTPAPSTKVAASFLTSGKFVPQSMGRGIMMRYTSVITLEVNVTQTTGCATAPWQESSKMSVSTHCLMDQDK